MSLRRLLSPWPPETSVLRCSQKEFWFSLTNTEAYISTAHLAQAWSTKWCVLCAAESAPTAGDPRVSDVLSVLCQCLAQQQHSAHSSLWGQSFPHWAFLFLLPSASRHYCFSRKTHLS